MTRAQIEARARLYYSARTSPQGIPEPDWTELFDLAYEQMSVEAECLPFSYTTSLVDSQRTYMIPTYVVKIRPGGVTTTTSGELLGPVSVDLLEDEDKNWKTTEGTPQRWYVAEQTATSGSDTNWAIGFYPVPPANATNELTIIGYRTPAALTAATDVPVLPAHLHDCFAWGMAYFAALRDTTGERVNQFAESYFVRRYEQAVTKLRGGRTGIGGKTWVRGGTAPGFAADSIEAGMFRVEVTSSS